MVTKLVIDKTLRIPVDIAKEERYLNECKKNGQKNWIVGAPHMKMKVTAVDSPKV